MTWIRGIVPVPVNEPDASARAEQCPAAFVAASTDGEGASLDNSNFGRIRDGKLRVVNVYMSGAKALV